MQNFLKIQLLLGSKSSQEKSKFKQFFIKNLHYGVYANAQFNLCAERLHGQQPHCCLLLIS